MQHPFEALKPEYDRWLAGMEITRHEAVRYAVHDRIMPRLADYQALAAATGVPAAFIGALDFREDDCDARKGLGQGDPWNRVSTHVPKGKGPFGSWLAAGKYYVHYDSLDRPPSPYALDVAAYKGEAWNGWGYRGHGIRSPYLVGGTNLQQRGKYVADGKWDGGTMDTQVGILPIMVELIRLRPELAFGPAVPILVPPAPPLAPDAPPLLLPAEFRASIDGAKWVQSSLNALHAVPADIVKRDGTVGLDVDGSYGRRTRAAVRAFQMAHGLEADGLVGNITAKAIQVDLDKLPPAAPPQDPLALAANSLQSMASNLKAATDALN